MTANTLLLAAHHPVFRIDGELKGTLTRDLVRLEVDEDCGGLKRLAARFTAWGPGGDQEGELYLDGKTFDFGQRLEVVLGPQSAPATVFTGRISAIEALYREKHPPEILVFAEDALMQLRMRHRFKTWENLGDGDIVRQIASDHGLSADIDAEGPTHPVVQQWNISDLAFLRERARLLRAEIWLQDSTLCFKTRNKREGKEMTLVAGNDIIRLELRADLAHQRTAIHVAGYDPARRESIDETADAAVVRAEAGPGRSGVSILGDAFGEFSGHRVREIPLADDAATLWAKAEMLRRARSFVRATGVAYGIPELTVGHELSLERVAAPFAGGGYHVTRVTHTFDYIDGHRTAFEAERPMLEGA